jgi:hypothetical protein
MDKPIDPTMAVFLGVLVPPRCRDCRRQAHPYMVTNRLWLGVGMTKRADSHLCIPCLEKRIRRPLARRDLMRDRAGSLNGWMRWRRGNLVLLSPHDAWVVLRRQHYALFRNLKAAP